MHHTASDVLAESLLPTGPQQHPSTAFFAGGVVRQQAHQQLQPFGIEVLNEPVESDIAGATRGSYPTECDRPTARK
jgi:hypothetical protein